MPSGTAGAGLTSAGRSAMMDLVEIRDLDGPNIFLLEPAIKLEVAAAHEVDVAGLASRLGVDAAGEATVGGLIRDAVVELCERCGVPTPKTVAQTLETPDHLAIAFSWEHRRF